jgi:hypothetical protein
MREHIHETSNDAKFSCYASLIDSWGHNMGRGIVLALSIIGAAIGASHTAKAQYYYPPPQYAPPPDYDEPPPPPYGYYRQPYGGNCYRNGCCPPGMTIQGGECKPYRGPVGGGYGYNYNFGCPPHYSIQDGVCKPYRGY